jgi:hypothetical protein
MTWFEALFPSMVALTVAALLTWYTVWTWRWKADRGDHRLAQWYWHGHQLQGWPYRNGAAVVPIFAGFAYLIGFGTLVVLFVERPERLAWLAYAIGIGLFVLMFWALIRPPSWMQPPWLAEAIRREKAGLPSNVPAPPEGKQPVMSRRQFRWTVMGLTAFAVAWVALGLPIQYLLLGLGAGIPILVATRVRD